MVEWQVIGTARWTNMTQSNDDLLALSLAVYSRVVYNFIAVVVLNFIAAVFLNFIAVVVLFFE